VSQETADTLSAIQKKHMLSPQELIRGLLEQVQDYFTEHGEFSFPVILRPEREPMPKPLSAKKKGK
jgi:hypothetical protein